MSVDRTSAAIVGRFVIRSATRPAVWPFLRDAVVEVQPSGRPAQALVRVFTGGGALLRGYLGCYDGAPDGELRVTRIECDGQTYDLSLAWAVGDDGGRRLEGTWTSARPAVSSLAVTEGGWIAAAVDGTSAIAAA